MNVHGSYKIDVRSLITRINSVKDTRRNYAGLANWKNHETKAKVIKEQRYSSLSRDCNTLLKVMF